MTRRQVVEMIANILSERNTNHEDYCIRLGQEILEAFDNNDLLLLNRAQAGVISVHEEIPS